MSLAASLRPYPSYEACALSWLSTVPPHWSVRRIKYVVHEIDRRSPDGDGTLLSLTRARGLIRQSDYSTKAPTAASLVGYKLCDTGDVIMNRMQAWSGMFGIAREPGLVSPDYVVFKPLDGHDPSFLLHALRVPGLVAEFAAASTGIGSGFNRLYTDKFGAISMPLPPLDEQRLIARYVNDVDRRVNRLIQSKRRLMSVLAEQRQAIIDSAASRGLDPGIDLKPSGIAWLDHMPSHWKVLPFLRCAIERADYRGATPERVDSGVFLVTAKNIRMGWIDYETSKEYVREDQYDRIMRRGLPQMGDVLLTTEAPLGNVALVDREDVAFAQRVVRFRLDPSRLVPEFALFAFMSSYFQNQLRARATGSTAQGIKASKFPQLLVLVPSLAEQRDAVHYLHRELAAVEAATEKAQQEMDLIREYRTRLVADVVTGSVDVREAAADLEEVTAEEIETLDEVGLDEDEALDVGALEELDEVPA